jgi:chromosome segregation ATPase
LEAEAAKSRERIACLEREAEEQRAELARRAEWACVLDADLERARARMAELDAEVETRGRWAAGLEEQLSASVHRANALETEILERTKWAQDLDRQLSDRTQWAQRLESEAASLRRNLEQIQSTIWYRLGRRLGRVR